MTTTPKTAGGAPYTARPGEPPASRTARLGEPAAPCTPGLAEPPGPHRAHLDEPVRDEAPGLDVPPRMARATPSPCVPPACPPPLGQAWTLPTGPGCAKHARAILGEALALAGAPRPAIADARLMVSELATNAHQHARDHGPHELWLYAALPPGEVPADARGEVPGEARCAIFDRDGGARLPGYSWTSGDYGRGLSIVHELSEGRWGLLRTMSRCFPRGPGKAVWFALPVPLLLPAAIR